MCSRLSIFDPNLEVSLASQHGIHPDRWRGKAQYEPKYSVRCEKSAPVLMMDRTNPKEPNLILEQMRWGMRRKDFNDKTNTVDIFTAKATRLVDPSKAWGGIRQVQRCIVPCDGYYAILDEREGSPHFVKRENGSLLLLAALYELRPQKDGYGFAIVTTASSPPMSKIHDERPVFLLTSTDVNAWLDTSSGEWSEELSDIAENGHNDGVSGVLSFHAVSDDIRRRNVSDSPKLIEPLVIPHFTPIPESKPKVVGPLERFGFISTPSSSRAGPSRSSTSQSRATVSPLTPPSTKRKEQYKTSAHGKTPSSSRKVANTVRFTTPTPLSRKRAKGKDKETVGLTQSNKKVIYISSDDESPE